MPFHEAPSVELGSAPRSPSVIASPSPSEVSSTSSSEPHNVRATPLFRALALRPPEPEQPPGQDELERRLPGYRRIVIPRELTLIELLKQSSGVTADDEVLRIREAKLKVVAERVGLRRLHVLAPHLRKLTLDGSAISSLRDLGIGLIHLKVLSVNRCGLTSLDGIWGLGTLRELHAAGNRLRDLHPLAVLQKLHTLNLADNPLEETSRLWTLGVCGALRRIILRGTPLANLMEYRTLVASALPMLTHLDDFPLQDDSVIDEAIEASSESDADVSDIELDKPSNVQSDPQPGPSHENKGHEPNVCIEPIQPTARKRPATTECIGLRPRINVPPRPKTAVERNKPSKLHVINTLLDNEWHCSGSKLTSSGPVYGNLARALRRSKNSRDSSNSDIFVEQTLDVDCRAVAAEIPRALTSELWDKFKQDTGFNLEPDGEQFFNLLCTNSCYLGNVCVEKSRLLLRSGSVLRHVSRCFLHTIVFKRISSRFHQSRIEIDIDFNERPKDADPNKAIERLEQIEKETMERLNNENPDSNFTRNVYNFASDPARIFSSGLNDELWRGIEDLALPDTEYTGNLQH